MPRATATNKGVGYSRGHYISRWIAEGLFPNLEGDCGSPLSPISLHGFRFHSRRSSQARNRKTLRQVHTRRITKIRIDEIGLGAIDRHKSGASYKPPSRTNVYVNPNYKPPSRSTQVPSRPAPYHRPAPIKNTGEKRDVVLNGVAFQTSGRSLVRKDREYTLGKCGLLVLLTHALVPQPTRPTPPTPEPSNFKPAPRYPTRPRQNRQRARPGRNLTLTTGRTSSVTRCIHNPLTTYSPLRYKATQKRMKFSDKQCPRFTTTGTILLPLDNPLCPSESWYLITFFLLFRKLQQRSHLCLSA